MSGEQVVNVLISGKIESVLDLSVVSTCCTLLVPAPRSSNPFIELMGLETALKLKNVERTKKMDIREKIIALSKETLRYL